MKRANASWVIIGASYCMHICIWLVHILTFGLSDFHILSLWFHPGLGQYLPRYRVAYNDLGKTSWRTLPRSRNWRMQIFVKVWKVIGQATPLNQIVYKELGLYMGNFWKTLNANSLCCVFHILLTVSYVVVKHRW